MYSSTHFYHRYITLSKDNKNYFIDCSKVQYIQYDTNHLEMTIFLNRLEIHIKCDIEFYNEACKLFISNINNS